MTKLEAIVELTKSAMANGVIVAAHNSVHTTIEQANAENQKAVCDFIVAVSKITKDIND